MPNNEPEPVRDVVQDGASGRARISGSLMVTMTIAMAANPVAMR